MKPEPSLAWLHGLLDDFAGVAFRCRGDDARSVEYISRGCQQLTGHAPAWFGEMGRGLTELILPDDRAAVRSAIKRALHADESYEAGYRIQHPDGKVRRVLERGRACGVLGLEATQGFITEVTAAHEALAQSAEKERLVQAIFEQTSQFIGVLDCDGLVQRMNRAALEAAGLAPENVLGQGFVDMPWWRDSVDTRARIQEAVRRAGAGEVVRLEACYAGRNGGRACMDFVLSPVRNEHGAVVAIIPEGRDVTERYLGEHAFRALLEGTAGETGQAFFEATVARLARELGVRAALVAEVETARGQTWMRCLARWADGRADHCEGDIAGSAFAEVLTQPFVHIERDLMRHYRADALTAAVAAEGLLAMPVLDRAGGVLGLVAVFDDKPMPASDAARLLVAASAARAAVEIQHRRAEDAIHLMNVRLEHRVAERTAELAAANAELESFSHSVSHDLRSPLRAIDGFSRALEEDFDAVLNAEGRSYLQRIRAASQRMGILIDDLLRLSRATRVEMKRERVDLSELAATILRDLRRRDPERVVEFANEPGLVITADRALVGILLENLLDNAWKYTRHTHGARITLARASEEMMRKHGAEVFLVSDNGAGFDMRYVGKLFAPFQRLHGPAEFEGTGIGLATVRRIALRHGGQAWIEGAVGQGATVTFTSEPDRA